jgi:nicotinamide-nucleotide amidase
VNILKIISENQSVLAHVTQMIEGFYKRPITQINRDQALSSFKVCCSCTIKVGTAPGMWMKKENTVFISLPGVPYEMKYLVENVIIPKLLRNMSDPISFIKLF